MKGEENRVGKNEKRRKSSKLGRSMFLVNNNEEFWNGRISDLECKISNGKELMLLCY